MCTNIQYVSRRVYGEYKPVPKNNVFSEWKFSGSIRKLLPSCQKGADISPKNLSVVKDLIDKGLVLPVPCGSCTDCRILNKKHMAIRLQHEARYWKAASFVTLTYNNENFPSGGSVNAVDPANFVKDLRKQICRDAKCAHGKKNTCRGYCPKIKTFGCAEYGPKLSRPHYHLIIFGYQFDDLSHPKTCKNEFSPKTWVTYRSKKCAELWGKGFIEIGNVEPAAAEYVCGYTIKKIKGEKKDDHYKGKRPEGVVCRSQGIGHRFVMEYKDFLMRNGMVSFRKSKVSLPRYYRNMLHKIDPEGLQSAIKNWTKDKTIASLYKAVSPLRAKARGKIKQAEIAQESRSYESVA